MLKLRKTLKIKHIMKLLTMINKYITTVFIGALLFSNVACSSIEDTLQINSDGHLYLGKIAYSITPEVRAIFNERYTEKKLPTDTPSDYILSYEIQGKALFDVEVSNEAIFRLVLFKSSIPIKYLDRDFHVGSTVKFLMDKSSNCKLFSGESPGTYIACDELPLITFYTECEGSNVISECKINSVLLNNYYLKSSK